jgi:hypothetical protein
MTYGEIFKGSSAVMNTPVLWINKYLQEKVSDIFQAGANEKASFPFFPSTPSTINDLTEYFGESTQGVAATWDRLIKMNKTTFPHIKCEQVMYYFYANGENPIEKMITIQESVFRLMDRLDESAEEINNWARNRQIRLDDGTLVDCSFYFHNFKVYQLQETRDIIDFGTARTYGGNKIIIDYDYHHSDSLMTNASWVPEPRLATKIII